MGIGRLAVGGTAGDGLGQRGRLALGDTGRGVEIGCERELHAERRRQPDGAGRLGEAHDAGEAVVIGQRQRVEAEPGGLGDQLLGVRRAVAEGEVGVAVQLAVGNRALLTHQLGGRLERLAVAGPRRPVAAGVPRRCAGCPPVAPELGPGVGRDGAARERRLQLRPRPRRVVETHHSSIERTYSSGKSAVTQRHRDLA